MVDTAGKTQQLPAELLQGVEKVPKNSLYELIYRLRWALVLALLAAFVYMAALVVQPRGAAGSGSRRRGASPSRFCPCCYSACSYPAFSWAGPAPRHEGVIPSAWVNAAVGGNSLWANFFAAVAGAFMYFATLTEVPIVQGLMGAGMGKGPALALLLAGPALSLPSMLVLRSIMGTQKTVVYVSLVIVMATISGIVFGSL